MPTSLPAWRISVLMALVLALCGLLYSLSLPGTFVLDDHPNLTKLSDIRLPDDWSSLWQYVTTGTAGPLGRPVALLTFGLQYSAWSDNPAVFKITNIAIHLLNSLLVFCLAHALILTSRLDNQLKQRASWIALLTTGLYSLHPLQISTVAYTIQRMTLLGTLFSLWMLLAYLKARCHWNSARTLHSSNYLGLAFIAFLLAIFSKENTLTMLLVISVIELCLLEPVKQRIMLWRSLSCWLPLAVMVAFFAIEIPKVIQSYQTTFREFNLQERLLTQSRILIDYLTNIFYPDHRTYTLLHDDFLKSHSLFDPISTLYCTLILFFGLGIFWLLRRKFPELLTCLLAYFSAHLLESSIWALELYYEHRNNFPIFFVVFAISILLARISKKSRIIGVSFALAYLLSCTAATLSIAPMWSQPIKMVSWWYRNHPQSYLTQSYMIDILFETKNQQLALTYLEQQQANFPILTAIKQTKFYCQLNNAEQANAQLGKLNILTETYETQRHHHTLASQINELADLNCEGLDPKQLIRIMSELRSNARYADHPVINYKLGIMLYAYGEKEEGLDLIRMTFERTKDVMTGIIYAKISKNEGIEMEFNKTLKILENIVMDKKSRSILEKELDHKKDKK